MAQDTHKLLVALQDATIFLEDRLGENRGGTIYTHPQEIITCSSLDELEDAWPRLEVALEKGFHAAGLLSYELGYAFEARLVPLIADRLKTPLLWFGIFEPPAFSSAESLDSAFAALGPPPPIESLFPESDAQTHTAKIRRVLAYIEAGDIYQANLTFQQTFNYKHDTLKLYAALRTRQPVAHGGFARTADATILSVSPELWIDIAGTTATMRPMKGTAPRGENRQTDAIEAETLRADPKQQAENLMIVDLLRNDLARIATIGSVRVPALFTRETYPTFHALTSTITAHISPSHTIRDRIKALFPCGSIVGVPKIRAMQILHDLEGFSRGFYSGAFGTIAPNKDMNFNVAIRTAVIRADGQGCYGTGGGIVADSVPAAEYQEALLKSRLLQSLAQDYALLETFRWTRSDGFVRLPLHLARLARSAKTLGFALDATAVERDLAGRAENACFTVHTDMRVRIKLHRSGTFDIAATPLGAPAIAGLRVEIAAPRLDPADPFLRHKTSFRDVYETACAHAQHRGLDEAIFLNRRGELAEGSRTSLFIERDGHLVTPTLSSGLLPGILRQTLLESGQAREQTLTLADLHRAPAWYLGNSLHGLRQATLVEKIPA